MTKKRLLLCTFTLVIVSLLLFALSGCVLFNKMCKHKNVIDDVGVAPTCTESGVTDGKHCGKCGDILIAQEELAPLGHSYSATVIASTCVAEGYTLHTCSACGDSYTDTKTPIIDHVYVPTQYEPLCNREGYTEYVCSGCNDSYKESFIPVTAHRFNDGACIYCSSEQPPEEIVADSEWYSDTKMVYTITTAEQLAGLATLVNEGASFDTKVVYLGADIDLQYLEWTPIGNAEHAFNGTFDGRGYTISNLKINTESSYLGLFGNVSGNISNFTIDNADIYVYDAYQYIGIACGYTTKDIKSVRVDGYIDAENSSYVGGVVGYTTAQLFDLSSDTHIVASDCVGGIAGYASVATALYNNLHNTGDLTGSVYVSGIVGYINATGTLYIEKCTNTGDVEGIHHVAGLFAYASGGSASIITDCSTSSDISAEYYVGAIGGEIVNVSIYSCSNEGSTISASSCFIENDAYYAYVGGYVGRGYSVEKCINNADIIYASRGSYVGGIAGHLSHSVADCTNNGKVSAYDYVGGIAGYIFSGTSVSLLTLSNTGDISGYAYVGGIAGSWEYTNTFVLTNCENSGKISGTHHVGGICGSLAYKTSALLTVSGLKNTGDVAAIESYAGGLFGYVSGNNNSVIEDCISSANISATHTIGGLIGWADNLTLKNSSNEGSTVTATGFLVDGTNNYAYFGGYGGRLMHVSGCTNNVDIFYNSLGDRIGGIAGYAVGNITDCTNNGDISSLASCVGGIVGCAVLKDYYDTFYNNLINTGNVTGNEAVSGIVGALDYEINYFSGRCGFTSSNRDQSKYITFYTAITNVKNSGNISGTKCVAGIFGRLYAINNYAYHDYVYMSHNHWDYGQISIKMSSFENSGVISGTSSTAEIFGYAWIEIASTIDGYATLDSITVDGKVLEGEYIVGDNHNVTVCNKILPETDESTEENIDEPV